ncbi:ribosome biogenesis protein NOP53 [Cymbomonas tetramitiformis]|uniref:Ribosome biogenesis protein NOP53 n=1 Tax=Cymbomonas tetramitiformis TaxID=36881 RepID=A0AAE0F2H5_9CHLO|nr:ribosome biogenesis protein NOP53 [Cymbomonas tetramitiformis]
MGKGKRKGGKKFTSDDFTKIVQHADREARTGGQVDDLPDDALFFVDSAPSEIPKVSKKDRRKNKSLNIDSILKVTPTVRFPKTAPNRKKITTINKPAGSRLKVSEKVIKPTQRRKAVKAYDLWGDDLVGESQDLVVSDVAASKTKTLNVKDIPGKPKTAATRSVPKVDEAGCSFNPVEDARQDVIAKAVAVELEKEFQKELHPVKKIAPMSHVNANLEDEIFRAQAAEEEEEEEEEEGAPQSSRKAVVNKKLTKAERNRLLRKRENQQKQDANIALKKQRRQLEQLKEIESTIEEEETGKEMKRQRNKTVKEDLQAAGPGRLGKKKFVPAPIQVQLSEDIDGSMRTLKGCPSLLKDSLKKFQHRGMIEPRDVVQKFKTSYAKSRIEYERGTRGETARLMHEAMLAEREAAIAERNMEKSLF